MADQVGWRIEDFPLTALPVDVQSLLLRSNSAIKHLPMRLNKGIMAATKHRLADEECELPISVLEAQNYEREFSPIARADYFFDPETSWYIARIILPNEIEYIADLNRIFGDVKSYDAKKHLFKMGVGDGTQPFEYDLITMYYCYKARHPCMEMNPSYAKKMVLRYFEEVVSVLSYDPMLVYLRSNARVMAIGTNYTIYKGTYRNSGQQAIDQRVIDECELLQRQIRNRLLALD